MKKLQWIILIALCIVFGLLWMVKKEKKSVQKVAGEKVEQKEGIDITFLDIGQGDATFIEFSDGEQMLVDCAVDGRILEALARVMNFYDNTIDYLVVTHPDLDHYGGCQDVLERFDISHVWYTGLDKSYDKQFQAWWNAVQQEGSEYKQIKSEEMIEIADTHIHVLYPDHDIKADSRIPHSEKKSNANNTSIVMRLDYGKNSVLLMGDAEQELEEYLLSAYEHSIFDVDILKLGHHGSDSSSMLEFIEAVTPEHAIASCGYNNKFGHPSRRILKRLERVDSKVWRTDIQHDIIVHIDKDNFEINGYVEN